MFELCSADHGGKPPFRRLKPKVHSLILDLFTKLHWTAAITFIVEILEVVLLLPLLCEGLLSGLSL